ISIGTKTRQPIICREENGRILLAGSVRGIRISQCAAAFADGARAGEWLVKKMRSNNESNRK
ncbi:MAG: hypothetical protein PHW02_05740, partial [bacterium]|nr:hypothetical protein [bacterium]